MRCKGRHPCAPCTKNKTECIFPVSGRIPRRARDSSYPNSRAQKQAELLHRLRRLEAMVGDLGSQVEHATAVSQGNHPEASSTSATSGETGRPDYRLALHSQSATGNTRLTGDGVRSDSCMATGTSESPHVSDESGELVTATSDGNLVVGDRFWTLFCKEVCSRSAPLFALLS